MDRNVHVTEHSNLEPLALATWQFMRFMQVHARGNPCTLVRVVDLSVPVVPVYPSETRGTDQPSVDSSLSPVAPNRPSLA